MPPERQAEAVRSTSPRASCWARAFGTLRRYACGKDGSRVDVLLSLTPLRDAGGMVIGMLAVTRDITASVLLRQASERARLAAEELACSARSRLRRQKQWLPSALLWPARWTCRRCMT